MPKHTEHLKDMYRSAGLNDDGRPSRDMQEGTRMRRQQWRKDTALAEHDLAEHPRPKTRAECQSSPRPCPYVSCKYHLAIEVNANGSITHYGDIETMTQTCCLDVADKGDHTLDQIGTILGLTRERTRQIEEVAMRKVKRLRVLGTPELKGMFIDHDNVKFTKGVICQSGEIGDNV